jgi:hypothetical protein
MHEAESQGTAQIRHNRAWRYEREPCNDWQRIFVAGHTFATSGSRVPAILWNFHPIETQFELSWVVGR